MPIRKREIKYFRFYYYDGSSEKVKAPTMKLALERRKSKKKINSAGFGTDK